MKAVRILLLAVLGLALAACATTAKKAALDEKNPQFQYEKAVIAYNYGLPDEALKYADLALALDPAHYRSYVLRGLVYIQKKNYDLAIAALEKAVELQPDSAEAYASLGAVHLELGQADKAKTELEKSYSLDGNPRASFNLAKLFLQKNEYETALDHINHTLQKNPRDAAALNLKGIILNELQRYPEAVASFQAALSVSPQDPNLLINLGIAFLNNGQPDDARAAFERSLPLIKDPTLQEKVKNYLSLIK